MPRFECDVNRNGEEGRKKRARCTPGQQEREYGGDDSMPIVSSACERRL